MKKITRNILAASLLLGFGACKKQLDLYPYSSIELSQSFKTVKDANTWNQGLYSDFRGRVYGVYQNYQDVQADYLNASLDYGNRNGNPHRWGTSYLADDGVFSGTWQAMYSALKNVNKTIEGFATIPTTTAAEADSMKRYTADAYIARAYYYSELIIRFSKPYEPATAASDPGVPLILTLDLTAQPARSSVKQVYDQILADIASAKALNTSQRAGAVGAPKFTRDVLTALEARVRLNMQDWAGAMTASLSLITAGTYPLSNTATEFSTLWVNDVPKETIMQMAVVKTTESANANNIYLGFRAADSKYQPDFIPTKWIIDLYAASDIRKGVYFKSLPTIIQGVNYPTLTLVNKFPGNPALFTAATTNYQHAPKVFRIAEQYLIYAEAAARAGGASEALGLTRLNELRVARGTAALTGVTGAALLQQVKDERTRELAFEGFRLWDLKRWHEGFGNRRSLVQDLGPIQQGANFNLLVIPADEQKFVWAVPSYETTLNKNLTQNAGY